MKADLIITNIGQLVTCSSDGGPKRRAEMLDVGILRDAYLAVADGKIASVGPSEELVASSEPEITIDAKGCVVCPGFVDPHTHIVFAGDRLDEFELKIRGADYLDVLAAGGGIISTVEHTRRATVNELVETAAKRLDRMLASGTTTCEIKTGYGLDLETEVKMLQVIELLDDQHPVTIIPTFLAAHAVPPEFKGRADAYVALVCDEMLPLAWEWYKWSHLRAKEIPFFCDVFCEKGAFNVEQSQRVLDTAKSIGFSLKAHVDEFTNLGGSWMAIEKGAVSIDHLDTISGEEIDLLAASDTVAVVTPTVNFNFGSARFADARDLIDRGCAVALSTDFNPGSAPSPSQPMAMAIACRYQKLLPSEAMNACTINAAHAVALGDRIGSIEKGKQADIVLLDTQDYRQLPYEFASSLVTAAFKNGRQVFGDAV